MERLKIDDIAIINHPEYNEGKEAIVRLRHTDHLHDKFLVELAEPQDWPYYPWLESPIRRCHLTKITPETHPEHYL